MSDLKTIWGTIASKYSNDTELIEKQWLEIEKCYSSERRYYHNLSHIQFMADLAYKYQGSIEDIDSLLFSIFYHDIVYNAAKTDNEVNSAEVACLNMAKIGVPSAKIETCKTQIIATKSHNASADNDTKYLLDFDLAILGEPAERYIEYTQQIRAEYAVYTDEEYNFGRKRAITHFLAMDRIFKTEELYLRLEQQARSNLSQERDSLS